MENKKAWIVTMYYTVQQYRTKESTKTMICMNRDIAITYAMKQIKNILDEFDKSNYSGPEEDLEWERLQQVIDNKLNKYNKYECSMFSNVTFELSEHNII